VNDALEGMWKEVVTAYFKVLFQHFPPMRKENNKILSPNSQSFGQVLNPEPPEYEGVLTT
jgi:hypothetical protein